MSGKRNIFLRRQAARASSSDKVMGLRRQTSVDEPVGRGQGGRPRLLAALWDALRLSY